MVFFVLCQLLLTFSSSTFASDRIDSDGRFLPFSGVTVISQVGASNQAIWENIYRELSQDLLITRYYSPLPLSSYHMTINNLYVSNTRSPLDWSCFISNNLPWFSSLEESLERGAFLPKVYLRKRAYLGGVVMFLVDIEGSQMSKIKSFGKTWGLEAQVPSDLHITLAYQYRTIPAYLQSAVEEKVQAILDEARKFQKPAFYSFEKMPLTLEEPKLCYFQDMTQFLPWDGKKNPFHEQEY